MITIKDIETILQQPEAVKELSRLYNRRYLDAASNAQYKAAIKSFQVQIAGAKINKKVL